MDLTKSLCRVCLRTDDYVHLNDWYSPMQELDETVAYVECFWRCTRLKVNVHLEGGDQDDQDELGYIRFLCNECCNDLESAYKFLIKSEQSDGTLRALCAAANATIKSEPMEQATESLIDISQFSSHDTSTATNTEDGTFVDSEVIVDALECTLGSAGEDFLDENPLKEVACSYYSACEESLSDQEDALNTLVEEQLATKQITRRRRRKKGQINTEDEEKPCEHCAKPIPTYKLDAHVAKCHGPKPVLLCYACPRTYHYPGSLSRHEATHKERERKYKCQLCVQSFFVPKELERHMKIHEANRQPQYQCEHCDKTFFYKGSLTTHNRIHEGVSFECHICEKSYTREFDLKIHMRGHSGELPYECSICGKRFRVTNVRNAHERRHAPTCCFKCGICDEKFSSRSTCQQHRFEAHGGMPLKCAICDKGFYKKKLMRRHMEGVHKVNDEEEIENLTIQVKTTYYYRGRILQK